MSTFTFANIATQRFERLLAIAPIRYAPGRQWIWVCVCDCGKVRQVSMGNLRSHHTTSCGCLLREKMQQMLQTHGKSTARIYKIYKGIKYRCQNPNGRAYQNYGGRGITCTFASFADFYAAMGDPPGPGYSIDRKENNGPYSKANCRWATRKEQSQNTRRNHKLTYQKETHTVSEWAQHTGIPSTTIAARIRLKWSVERALTTPVRQKRS